MRVSTPLVSTSEFLLRPVNLFRGTRELTELTYVKQWTWNRSPDAHMELREYHPCPSWRILPSLVSDVAANGGNGGFDQFRQQYNQKY